MTRDCIADPFSSFLTAGVAMLLGMACVTASCWAAAAASAGGGGVRAAQPHRRPKVDCLDGMRTVVATYVILYHQQTWLPRVLASCVHQGQWSMQLFFVLSGFVLHRAAEGKL